MSKPDLLVAPCSYEAAKYAVEHWHYSQAMPAGKLVKFGVWENNLFIGAVIFGRGVTKNLFRPYGLKQQQGCELVRIALSSHQTPVTQIASLSFKMLKKHNPGLRLIVSFADTAQSHNGAIYQAGNWIYSGLSGPKQEYIIKGRRYHPRSFNSLRPD